jgi:hypothetical protein
VETGKLDYKPSERREPGDRETRVQAFREKGTCRLGNSSTSLQREGNLQTGKLEYKPGAKGTWRLGN